MHPRVFATTLLVVGSIAYGLARVGPPSFGSAGDNRPDGWS